MKLRWPKADTTVEQVLRIPVDAIRQDPSNPRRYLDPDALAELAEQLRTTGRLLQPIRVRQDDVGYLIVTGQRRLEAARRAGWETIPAIVDNREGDPAQWVEDQLIENLARDDLKPLDAAQAIQWLLDHTRMSRVDLAARLGRSSAWITRHTKLLALEGPVRTALEEGVVGCADAAAFLSELTPELQAEVVEEARETGATVSRATARRAVDDMHSKAKQASADDAPRMGSTAMKGAAVRVSLRALELRWILRALGGDAPDQDADLVPALRNLLARRLPQAADVPNGPDQGEIAP